MRAQLEDSSEEYMQFRMRKLVKPEDLNPRHTLFGGRLLAWIDEECAIYASCQLETSSLVTKYMSEINFRRPAHCGDVIELGVETVQVGTTSLTVRCEVREKLSKSPIITVDRIVFVALDAQGLPVPHVLASREEREPSVILQPGRDYVENHDPRELLIAR